MNATTEEKVSFFACSGFQLYVSNFETKKRLLAMMFQIERFTIWAFSIFVGHGHLQHAGAG